MTGEYRIFGSEMSSHCVKVRSYFRYKGLPHRWIVRGASTQAEFAKFAKLPLIPLVVTPEGDVLQDSTSLIEELERRHPEPSLQPADVPRAFLSSLIEEFADEWCNKAMFHFRWTSDVDQMSAALRIAKSILGPDAAGMDLEHATAGVRERMVPRLSRVGSHAGTAPLIEVSFRRQLEIADAHLMLRPYLFGGRPCLADLGWSSQMYQMSTDPTPQALMQHFPGVLAWVARMQSPVMMGEFEAWDTLSPTLTLLLQEEVARRYLPWADANANAVSDHDSSLSVNMGGVVFSQSPQKTHVKGLTVIREKARAALEAAPELAAVLKDTGCYDLLTV